MASTHLETPCEMPPTEAGSLKNKVIPYWDDLRWWPAKDGQQQELGGGEGRVCSYWCLDRQESSLLSSPTFILV